MLETITSWIASVAGELLDWIVTRFLSVLTLDLHTLTAMFPFFVTGYRIFQSVGIGIVLLIAIVQLFAFFAGTLTEVRESPLAIAVRSAIAGMGIFFFGHFMELIVRLAQIPFNHMLDADAMVGSGGISINADWIDAVGFTSGSASTVIVAGLIIILLIGWNLIKLMIEVAERYIMVGILAFTAPLAVSTIVSKNTSEIFKRFMSMFIGQCFLMTISVWFLKIAISGFSISAGGSEVEFVRLVLTLAVCKIAQRADNIFQQLGIGVTTTGGNLLDEVIAVGAMGARFFRGKGGTGGGGSHEEVLGDEARSLSKMGGLWGGLSNMAQRGYRDFVAGKTFSEIGKNAGRNFFTGANLGAINKYRDEKLNLDLNQVRDKHGRYRTDNLTAEQKAALSNAKKDVAKDVLHYTFDGGVARNAFANAQTDRAAAIQRNADLKKGSTAAAGAAASTADRAGQGIVYKPSTGLADSGEEANISAKDLNMSLREYTAYKRDMGGVGDIEHDENGRAALDAQAQSIGLFWDNNTQEALDDIGMENAEPMNIIYGDPQTVGDFVAAHYATDDPDLAPALVETVKQSDPKVAEQVLWNPNNELDGNQDLGDALIKKAFGEKKLTGQEGGRFTKVSAPATEDGTRRIETDYVAKDGTATHFTIMNENALHKSASLSTEQRAAIVNAGRDPGPTRGQQLTSREYHNIRQASTGEKYLVHKTQVLETENLRSDTPPVPPQPSPAHVSSGDAAPASAGRRQTTQAEDVILPKKSDTIRTQTPEPTEITRDVSSAAGEKPTSMDLPVTQTPQLERNRVVQAETLVIEQQIDPQPDIVTQVRQPDIITEERKVMISDTKQSVTADQATTQRPTIQSNTSSGNLPGSISSNNGQTILNGTQRNDERVGRNKRRQTGKTQKPGGGSNPRKR